VQTEQERNEINERSQLRWSGTPKIRKIGDEKSGFQIVLKKTVAYGLVYRHNTTNEYSNEISNLLKLIHSSQL
jgi:hypothetical protein